MTLAYVMAPFLCDAIFNEKTSDTLKLIILAQEAAIKFDAPTTEAWQVLQTHLHRIMLPPSQTGPLQSILGN